jgi:hypothetical protein
MPDLRPGQYKRLGRIAENNPERASKVADRMEKRASREERGREVAGNTGRGVAKYRSASEVTRAEENPRAREEARKKINDFAKESENFVKKAKRPDTPLAPTPEPLFSRR